MFGDAGDAGTAADGGTGTAEAGHATRSRLWTRAQPTTGGFLASVACGRQETSVREGAKVNCACVFLTFDMRTCARCKQLMKLSILLISLRSKSSVQMGRVVSMRLISEPRRFSSSSRVAGNGPCSRAIQNNEPDEIFHSCLEEADPELWRHAGPSVSDPRQVSAYSTINAAIKVQ